MKHQRLGPALVSALVLLSVAACGGGSTGGATIPSGPVSTATSTPAPRSSASPSPSPNPSAKPTATPTAKPTATPTPPAVPTPRPATIMYVADYNASNVYVYSTGPTPALLRTLTTNVNNPSALAVDSSGKLYVLDNTTGRVVEFPAGQTTPSVTFFSGFPTPTGIAVGPDGTVYVSNSEPNVINVFHQGSTTVNGTLGTDLSPSNSGFQGLAVDRSGNLYAAGYTTANTPTVFMIAGGTSSTTTDLKLQGLVNPGHVTFDAAGDLVVTDDYWAGFAIDIYPAGATTYKSQLTSGLLFPGQTAYDATGTLWVPNGAGTGGTNGNVVVFPPGATSPTTAISSGLQAPDAIAFGAN